MSVGTPLSGSVHFEAEQSSSHSYLLGDTFGDIYQYELPLTQTISASGLEWLIRGAQVSLTGDSHGDWQAFDVYSNSTSASNSYESFPNYAGHFAVGFALFDDDLPLALFDIREIENTAFDFTQITRASGFLMTTREDSGGEFVEVYYVTFDINTVSSVPEPSAFNLILGALSAVSLTWRNRSKRA